MLPRSQQEATLKIYLFYRLTLSIALLALFFIDQSFETQAQFQNSYYLGCALFYFFTCSLSLALNAFYETSKKHIYSIILIDIISLSFMHFFTGGMTSGINILLFFPTAASAIFFLGLAANFTAAISTIAVLLCSYYFVFIKGLHQTELLASGILGLGLFTTSFLVQRLANNIRKAQEELEEQSEEINYLEILNQHIVQRLRTGIIVFDNQNKIKLSNNAAQSLLGEEFSSGKRIYGGFLTEFTTWKNTLKKSETFQQEKGLPEIKVNFIENKIGNSSKDTMAFIENTSELSQQAQQIKLASLGRLSASIAHEIRNPLSAISHSTQLLNESEHIHASDARLLEIINTHIKRLNNIIDNTLSISKRSEPKISPINLIDFTEEIKEQHLSKFSQYIEVENKENLKLRTVADISQISQVMTNLLENALHYSYEATGKFWVKVQLHQDINDRAIIRIFDHGPGIMPENIDKVFEPFYTTRKAGTGLGLFIAKELCELNHAELDYVTNDTEAYFQIRFAHAEKAIQ